MLSTNSLTCLFLEGEDEEEEEKGEEEDRVEGELNEKVLQTSLDPTSKLKWTDSLKVNTLVALFV